MELTQIILYPIKAFGPCPVKQAQLTPAGLAHDRRWMLIDPVKNRFISQRQLPKLARFQTEIDGKELYILAPSGEKRSVPLTPTEGTPLQAQIWESTVDVWGGWRNMDEWLSGHIGQPVQLVYLPEQNPRWVTSGAGKPGEQVSLADSFPFLLVGTASIEEVGKRQGWTPEVLRFRPNFVLNTTHPFEEEEWTSLQMGDHRFRNARPCPRCQVINVNPATGEKDQSLLQDLGKWRKQEKGIPFGIHLVWEEENQVSYIQVGEVVKPYK